MEKRTRKGISVERNEKGDGRAIKREESGGRETRRERSEERREVERQDVRTGTSTLKKRKRKRMVLVQQGPQDTGKEYPRIVEDASLPSPSFSCPFYGSFRSLFLPLPLRLSFQVVNMPHPVPSGFIPRKGNRRLLQTLHREGVPTSGRSFSFALTDLGVARFFFLSHPPSFYAPQDFGTDCEIKGSPKSLK